MGRWQWQRKVIKRFSNIVSYASLWICLYCFLLSLSLSHLAEAAQTCLQRQLQPKVAQIRVHNNLPPDTKSNPNPNPTTKQHAIVNIHLNIVACPTYPDKFIVSK